MDPCAVAAVKVIEILPELQLGGVERHVIDLSNELTMRGHKVLVISAGGQMESQLDPCVERRHLSVQKKNPITGWLAAHRIATWAQKEGWQLLHAHSRVPAWIAEWASGMAHIPYIVTAHVDFGNKSPWIYRPYRQAFRTICVSGAVRDSMKTCFYDNTQVVLNGLDEPKEHWQAPGGQVPKLLFVGRLSSVKGLQDVLKAMPQLPWTMDVVGDGPQMAELEQLAASLGFADRVEFHGYSEHVDDFMAHSSLLLFPSYQEGMPLTLARAIQIGIPIIASDIGPVAEMAVSGEGLLPPGEITAWNKAVTDYLKNGTVRAKFSSSSVPTLSHMVDQDLEIYRAALSDGRG